MDIFIPERILCFSGGGNDRMIVPMMIAAAPFSSGQSCRTFCGGAPPSARVSEPLQIILPRYSAKKIASFRSEKIKCLISP